MEITMRFNESRCDAGKVMQVIRENLPQIADSVEEYIAERLSSVFENQHLQVSGKEKASAVAAAKAEKTKPPYIEEPCKTKRFESVVACIHGHLVYLNSTLQDLGGMPHFFGQLNQCMEKARRFSHGFGFFP